MTSVTTRATILSGRARAFERTKVRDSTAPLGVKHEEKKKRKRENGAERAGRARVQTLMGDSHRVVNGRAERTAFPERRGRSSAGPRRRLSRARRSTSGVARGERGSSGRLIFDTSRRRGRSCVMSSNPFAALDEDAPRAPVASASKPTGASKPSSGSKGARD